MTREPVISALREQMADFEPLRGLFLGGSLGRGTADQWSDIDFVGVSDGDTQESVVARWSAGLERVGPIVHRMQRQFGPTLLLNVITRDWLRIDLLLVRPGDFAAGRSKDRVQVLIDRDGVAASLPTTLPTRDPDPARVRTMIDEFVRIMGLLPVVAGRDEWFVAANGTGLLRGLVQDLLMEKEAEPDRGGALQIKRYLPPDDVALLTALPFPSPHRDAVIAAHAEIARVFISCAQPMATALGLEWPHLFVAATRERLRSTLGNAAADW